MEKLSLYDVGLSNDEPATQIKLDSDTICKVLLDINGDYIAVYIGYSSVNFADEIAEGIGVAILQLKDIDDCRITTDTEIFGKFSDGRYFSYTPWSNEPWYIEKCIDTSNII